MTQPHRPPATLARSRNGAAVGRALGRQLLLLLLCALGAVASATAASASCDAAVPRDAAAWPSSADVAPHTLSPAVRGRLARAALAASTPDAWVPLIAKLRRGEAINVVAFGSSIVQGHAGSFVSSAAVLKQAGVQALMPPLQRLLEDTGSAVGRGYLESFMAAINATWPNPGHLFLNIGRGAVSLGQFTDVLCIERMLPLAAEVDLLLFETHSEDGAPGHEGEPGIEVVELMERLHTYAQARLSRGNRTIPLVMLSVLPLVKGFESSSPRKSNKELCTGDRGVHCAEPTCAADAHVANIFTDSALGGLEAHVAAAARRYGWALISVRDAMAAGLRDQLHTALNISGCEWASLFYADPMHPGWKHGMNLIGDALLSLLVAAQDVSPPGCQGELLPPVRLLPAPLTKLGRVVTPHSCVEAEYIVPIRNESFHYVRHELVNGAIVYKDGWVGNVSGALLEFAFRTKLPELPADARARLTLRILTSYEGMGAAALSCVAGCACEPATLQGHVSGSVSVEFDAHLPVTQAEACTLQLRVLPETSSGGHKFKLLGVSLGALPPPTASRRRAQ